MEFCKRVILFILWFYCYQAYAVPSQFMDGIYIYSADGTKLSANVHMPANSPSKWPLIILPNSWNLDEYEYYFPARKLAEKGYIVLSYSARGWGKSDGQVEVASANDMADVDAVINWAIQALPCDPDKIGMAGISYGGGLSLLAATRHSKIKAVVIMSGWADLETALYGNQTPANLWGNLLVSTGKILGHLHPDVAKKFDSLLQHLNVEETIRWSKKRSPMTYIDSLNRHQVAVYLSQNLGDRLFTPNPMLSFFQQLQVPKRLDLNQGIHASAEASALFGFDNYVWNQALRWFDHWLKGKENGIEKSPLVSIEIKKGQRVHYPQWPIEDNRITFYLRKRPYFFYPGQLTTSAPTAASHNQLSFSKYTGVHSGLPIIAPILEANHQIPILAWLPGVNFNSAIYYQTPPFKQARTIIGIPHVQLWYRSSDPRSQLVAYLYEVDRFGLAQLIAHAPISRYHARPDAYHLSEFDLSMTAHTIQKGHRLALALGTYDVLYAPPVSTKYQIETGYGLNMASNIMIPFILDTP